MRDRALHSRSIPVPLSYPPPLSLLTSPSPRLSLASPFSLHCVIRGLIPVLSFNIFLSSRWISENETLWATRGLCVCVCVCVCGCVSLGCSLNCRTDESIQAAQSVAFSRKPICCLIDLSKDKTTLYFGGLSIWKAVNSVRSGEKGGAAEGEIRV